YALLLSHDAQRLLFPRPKVNVGASNIASDVSPRIADPYRMLQSTGLFPRFEQAIDVAQKVELTPGALRLATGTLEFSPPPGTQGLLDRGAWKDELDYSKVRFKIDSLANWHVDVE